jgi:tetratricopeptide (TPR) repeat protein
LAFKVDVVMKQEKIDKILVKANSAIKTGKFGQAVITLKKINNLYSLRTYQSLSLETIALISSNKNEKALETLTKTQQLNLTKQEQIDTWGNIGKVEQTLGKVDKAINSLEKSINLDDSIDNAEIQLILCELYQETRCFSKLESLVTKLKGWEKYYAPAQFQLILSAQKSQNKALVISCVKHLTNHFRHIEEKYIVGSLHALHFVSATTEAYLLLDKAENYLGKKSWMPYQRAINHYDNKEYKTVIELITDKSIQSLPPWMALIDIYQLRANAYDKLKQFDQAFQDYSTSAELIKEQSKHLQFDDDVESYRAIKLTMLPEGDKPLKRYTPIFMIGFPRSGTTLLDTILETQENVVTLSETASIYSVILAFGDKLNKKYPNDLKNLSKCEINILRDIYYDFVDSLQLKINSDTLIIDKMPLNTIHLPLILTLFPGAKVIFSLRHPLDVCLSNFQQNFRLNKEMYHLISLDSCVKRYKQVFSLFEIYQRDLKPDIFFVRYEDLVTDLSKEINKVFTYLNIENNNQYQEFHKQAKAKIISTPSRKQVTKELYTSSKYKWKNYSKYMVLYKTTLQVYINRFGYNSKSL